MFSPLLLKLIGLAVLAGGIFFAGYNTKGKFDTAALAKAQAAAEAVYKAKDVAYNQVASDLEKAKSVHQVQTKVITKRVVQIVQHPIYSNVCLDPDGVSVVNDAINRKPTNPAQPDTAMPSPDNPK